jgi:hypothetical protein
MATRINVTAVRDCPAAEVRAVMGDVLRPACAGAECAPVGEALEIHEHNGWTWFVTSVWGVSAADLNRGLCRLARPAVQFTTSDAERWYLTVHGGPQGQVHFLHEFAFHGHDPDPAEDVARQEQLDQQGEVPAVDPRLAFLEEEPPPGGDRVKVPFDVQGDCLTSLGASIPDEFRATVAGLPYSQAAARYRRWHAECVSEALTAAGIVHDPAAVRAVLLWENVTPGEAGSDLGNLPRLLAVLGLGGQWDDWVRQAEAPPPPPPEPACAAPAQPVAEPQDLIRPARAIVEPLGLTPVADGAVALPLDELGLLRFFPEALAIYDTAGVAMTVTLPQGFAPTAVPGPTGHGGGQVEMSANGFQVGLHNHLWFGRRDLTQLLGDQLSRLLYHLPDGAVLDLAFALEGKPALCQRYRGVVAGGSWWISETYPPLAREALAGGLELARYAAAEHEKHEARDEAEAEAVVALARRDPNLWDMKVKRLGRVVWCKADITGHLAKVFFRHRFAGSWDIAAHDREAERQYQEHLARQRAMRQGLVQAARRRAGPHGEVLLKGKLGLYWRSDFADLAELEHQTREKIDAGMAGLGLRHIGDLVAKKQRDIVLRSYASEDRLVYGILMAKRTMYLGYEFYSRFANGATLTTTTNGAASSQPERKVYAKIHPGLEPAALHDKHQWGIERFRARRATEPVRLEPTLLGVARELDRLVARREAVGLLVRIVATPAGEPPLEIRAAWVGCVLPVFAGTDDPRVANQQRGVLSREPTDQAPGWAVQVTDAVRALEQHNARAAQWWQENTPDIIQPGKLLVFRQEDCELLEEADAAG